MIKKILLVTSLIFGSLSYANAQTAPIDLSKGITVKQLNDAFSSKIDTSRIGQPNGVAPLDSNGNITTGRITSNSESHFSNGTFNDPDLGVTRDAKFGNSGIAVTGGIKTDNINVTNTLTSKTLIIPSATLSTLPSSPSIGMAYIVTDGRKPGESAGAGSGAYCVYDGKEWMNVSTGVAVTN